MFENAWLIPSSRKAVCNDAAALVWSESPPKKRPSGFVTSLIQGESPSKEVAKISTNATGHLEHVIAATSRDTPVVGVCGTLSLLVCSASTMPTLLHRVCR